jgi:hypothetical protein
MRLSAHGCAGSADLKEGDRRRDGKISKGTKKGKAEGGECVAEHDCVYYIAMPRAACWALALHVHLTLAVADVARVK